MKSYFLAEHDLFQGLWIADKLEEQPYPIIHLSLNDVDYEGSDLETALAAYLQEIASQHKLELSESSLNRQFRELIHHLSQTQKVVVLIDEYDKPIIDYLEEPAKAVRHREILRHFYAVLKATEEKLRFVFLTGISKFSKVSIFSDLNHLNDISLSPQHSKIVGLTRKELESYFPDRIKSLQKSLSLSKEAVYTHIQQMYNGYSWDGNTFLYNPFSILKCLADQEFGNYWFSTGTPSVLAKTLIKHQVSVEDIEGKVVTSSFFDRFNIEQLDVYNLLFQAGYLSIKSVQRQGIQRFFMLGFPNNEVRSAFSLNLLAEFSQNMSANLDDAIVAIRQALNHGKPKELITSIQRIFADISYHLHPRKKTDRERYFEAWEGWFQTVIYLIFSFIGASIQTELTKHKGRIDLLIETEEYIYIIELKIGTAAEALQQIKQQQYGQSYQNTHKSVYLVGIGFGIESRNIESSLIETLN